MFPSTGFAKLGAYRAEHNRARMTAFNRLGAVFEIEHPLVRLQFGIEDAGGKLNGILPL